jgi:excisionase family DNA binding protein
MNAGMKNRLMTVDEVAAALGIAPRTIRNRMSDKTWKMQVVRIGRRVLFRESDVDLFIENGGDAFTNEVKA